MEAPYKCFSLLKPSDHIKLINLRQQDREKMLEIFRQFLSHGVSLRDLRITALLQRFQNKRYVIKIIIIYVLERKITDLKIRGVVC